jgi:hypothetical protein
MAQRRAISATASSSGVPTDTWSTNLMNSGRVGSAASRDAARIASSTGVPTRTARTIWSSMSGSWTISRCLRRWSIQLNT